MKRTVNTIFSALAALMLFSGCIKETFPQGSVQTADQIQASEKALPAMLNAIPASMMMADAAGNASQYGDHTDFGIAAIHLATEYMLEDVATMGDNPYYNRFYPWAGNMAQGASYIYCAYFWECYYKWIKSANDMISLVDYKTASETSRSYLGQAYAYRAMFYLDLARLFEPKAVRDPNISGYDVSGILGLTVPLVTEETTESMAMNNPRVDRKVMYDFIIGDLQKAEECFGTASAKSSYTTPGLAAVYGMFARAYLEMGYWTEGDAGDAEAFAKAAEYARKAIETSGKTPLTQAQWEDPATGFNSGSSNNAWIWGLTLSSQNIGNLLSFTAHISSEATWGYAPLAHVGASASFYNAISDSDFRKHSWLDPQKEAYYAYKFAGTETDKAKYLAGAMSYENIKFRPAQGEVTNYAVGSCADHPLMRVEEMYFIEIEATAHSDLSKAQTLLNDFMGTYRITDGSYDCRRTTSNLSTFLSEMLFQKRVEFWGEGILFYDYKRLDKGITRGYAGTNHAGVYCFNVEGRSPQWNIVITRGEFQSNTAINDSNNNPDPSDKIKLWVN